VAGASVASAFGEYGTGRRDPGTSPDLTGRALPGSPGHIPESGAGGMVREDCGVTPMQSPPGLAVGPPGGISRDGAAAAGAKGLRGLGPGWRRFAPIKGDALHLTE